MEKTNEELLKIEPGDLIQAFHQKGGGGAIGMCNRRPYFWEERRMLNGIDIPVMVKGYNMQFTFILRILIE